MPLLDVFEKAGHPLNPDHNSSNPIGISILINSAYNGLRTTAADSLSNAPDNLTIITETPHPTADYKGQESLGCREQRYPMYVDHLKLWAN